MTISSIRQMRLLQLSRFYEEASRFGIMNTGEDDRIVEFEEKRNTRSNLAPWVSTYSTGSFITSSCWQISRIGFQPTISIKTSSLHSLQDKALYAYKFKGYWKDVGTIDSLWEANMDLLSLTVNWILTILRKIYTEDATLSSTVYL